jgi:hypothetical protein
MALEERNGNYYYYKKERDGKRVVSKYYGKGELASLVAQLDKIELREKKIKILENIRFKQETQEIDREIDLYENKVKEIITQTLVSLGFHKTKSREWRLKAK